MATGKFHNEDLSVYFFVKSISLGSTTLGNIAIIVDGYPYNELESGTLTLPTVSIEAILTSEEGGELGASWFRRSWSIDIFANTDVQRDDIADKIFNALDNAIPIKDYSVGYRKDSGLSLAGAALRTIEYMTPDNRTIRPTYGFNTYSKIKYWRTTVGFETVSTQAV
jgi:hypothetical protein